MWLKKRHLFTHSSIFGNSSIPIHFFILILQLLLLSFFFHLHILFLQVLSGLLPWASKHASFFLFLFYLFFVLSELDGTTKVPSIRGKIHLREFLLITFSECSTSLFRESLIHNIHPTSPQHSGIRKGAFMANYLWPEEKWRLLFRCLCSCIILPFHYNCGVLFYLSLSTWKAHMCVTVAKELCEWIAFYVVILFFFFLFLYVLVWLPTYP